ncbi:DUF6207 family protein [Streptomyces sp. NPDC096205]|uniref:DUF6207 family protein n=1 Tax=Streptomyces sp. NPDC096205 TaxID=3366081 RepID=UPI00380A67EC
MAGMRQISDTHVATAGLAVVEAAAPDEQTALAIHDLLAAHCALAPANRTYREPGEPGIRLRCYPDLNQTADGQHSASLPHPLTVTGRPVCHVLAAQGVSPAQSKCVSSPGRGSYTARPPTPNCPARWAARRRYRPRRA